MVDIFKRPFLRKCETEGIAKLIVTK